MPFNRRHRLLVVAFTALLLLACQFGSRSARDRVPPTPSPTAPARIQALSPTPGMGMPGYGITPTWTPEAPTATHTPSPTSSASPTVTPSPTPSPTPELPDAGPLPALWTEIDFGEKNAVSKGTYHPYDLALDDKAPGVVYALGRCSSYSQYTSDAPYTCISAFGLGEDRVLSPGAVGLPAGVWGEGRLHVAGDALYLHLPWAGNLYALDRQTLTVRETISDVYGIAFDGLETTYVVTQEGLGRLGDSAPARAVDRKYEDAPVEMVATAERVYVLGYESLQIYNADPSGGALGGSLDRLATVQLEGGQLRTLALDRKGGRLYIGGQDGLYALDTETHQLSEALGGIPNVQRLALDAAGKRLFVATLHLEDWFGGTDVVAIDTESWETQTLFSTLDGQLRDLILDEASDEAGDRLLIASYDDHALIPIDLVSGEIQPRMPLGVQVMEVIVSDAASGGDRLYVSDSAGWVHVLDRHTYDDLGRVYGGQHISLDAAQVRLGGHNRLYAGDPRLPEVTVFDAESLTVERTIAQPGKPRANPATGEVVIVNRRFYTFDGASGEPTGELLSGVGQPPETCSYCYYRIAREVIVDARRGLTATITYMPWPGKPGPRESIDYDPDSGRAYYSLLTGGYVAYSSIATYSDLSQLEERDRPVLYLEGLSGYIKLDPPARRLYVARGDVLYVLDSETLSRVGRVYTEGWTPILAAVDGELGRLYTALGSKLLVWTRTGGALPAPLPPEPAVITGTVASILPSPDYAGDGTLLATINGQLCRSTDRGRAWQRLRGGLPAFEEYTLTANAAFSPDYANDQTIFAGLYLGDTHGEGVYCSHDGGQTWELCSDGLYDLRVYRVVPSPTYAGDRTLLAYARIQSGEALYRSTGGADAASGVSWQLVLRQTSHGTPPLPRPAEMFALEERLPQFRCDYSGACERSDDGGETWVSFGTGGAQLDRLAAYALSPHFAQDRTVYFLTESDLYRYQEEAPPRNQEVCDWSICPLVVFGGRDYTRALISLAVAATDAGHDLFVGSAVGEFYRFAAQELPWAEVVSVLTPPVPAPTPTPCAQAIDGRLETERAEARDRLGCATAPGAEVAAAFQPFERGMMFWRGDLGRIYVLQEDGTWASYEDTWDESQPDHDPDLAPPEGLCQPLRGFGKVWREHLGGAGAPIGWATAQERGYVMVVQPFVRGLLFGGANDEVYALYDDGTWEQL